MANQIDCGSLFYSIKQHPYQLVCYNTPSLNSTRSIGGTLVTICGVGASSIRRTVKAVYQRKPKRSQQYLAHCSSLKYSAHHYPFTPALSLDVVRLTSLDFLCVLHLYFALFVTSPLNAQDLGTRTWAASSSSWGNRPVIFTSRPCRSTHSKRTFIRTL